MKRGIKFEILAEEREMSMTIVVNTCINKVAIGIKGNIMSGKKNALALHDWITSIGK